MMFNERDLRVSEQRRKDLRREAEQRRLVNQTLNRQSRKTNPLWMRLWTLFL